MSVSIVEKIKKFQADIVIVGAGLAGSECAWQLLRRNLKVCLIEQRPQHSTEAHKTGQFAELVCSNSFKTLDPESAPNLLKEELKSFDSLIMQKAFSNRVAAGQALAVEREKFSEEVTETLKKEENLLFLDQRVEHFEELLVKNEKGENIPVVLATGPLTYEKFAESLHGLTGERLYFYDAIAPIIDGSTINRDKAFMQNRRNKGDASFEKSGDDGDYLNCPLTKDEYYQFIEALEAAEKVPSHNFEKTKFFQGCQPIEAMLERGPKTLAFGPMKPVGLKDPRKDEDSLRPYAVVQLRKEDNEGRSWNMVGFQTKLKYGEQKKVFSLIPGLENAEFYRMGSLHRNTFINSPAVLNSNFALNDHPHIYFAGQITGVEGYLESTAVGLLVALNIAFKLRRDDLLPVPPQESALGALAHAIVNGRVKNFQPMNINWGLIPYGDIQPRDKEKKPKLIARAQRQFNNWKVLCPKQS